MQILNFGSINIDHVYRVPHFVQPGETLASASLATVLGGKGANQSVALAKAGANVLHLGQVSRSDQWAVDLLDEAGVGTESVALIDTASGHAIIQVDDSGENSIILHGGANQAFSEQTIKHAISKMSAGDWLLIQNECNGAEIAMEAAKAQNMKIAFNPAPMTDAVRSLPLELVDLLIVNQIEAQFLSGEDDNVAAVASMAAMAPDARILLTLGADGALLSGKGVQYQAGSPKVEAVDTTGAGDTFVGYFLAALIENMDAESALSIACRAAAIAVTRPGASPSIPTREEVNRSPI